MRKSRWDMLGHLRIAGMLIGFWLPVVAAAHDPHDVIGALAMSEWHGSLYVVRSHYLMLRSDDQGWSWKELVNGLDNRYPLTAIVAHGQTVLVSSDGDGIYRSNDKGSSWKRSNNGLEHLRIGKLAGTRNLDAVLAAGVKGGMYLLSGNQEAWRKVLGDDIRVTAMVFVGADQFVLLGTDKGLMLRSTNDGQTWTKGPTLEGGAITSIAADESGMILAGTETGGVLRSDDAGVSFRPANEGVTDPSIRDIILSPNFHKDGRVYLSTWHAGAFRSSDRGKTWTRVSAGLTTSVQAQSKGSIFYSPQFRELLIIDTGEGGQTLLLGGFDGLFRSQDSGIHWEQMETSPLGRILGLSVSQGVADYTLAVTTFGAGAYTSRDLGHTWQIHNRGLLNKPRITRMVFPPDFATSGTVFSLEEEGDYMLRSDNRGDDWQEIWLQPSWRLQAKRKWVGILKRVGWPGAPTMLSNAEKAKAHPKVLQLSPNYAEDGSLYVGTRFHGLYISRDKGRNVEPVGSDLQEIWTLDSSPDFKQDNTLFATARYKGVFKSTDAGEHWIPINRGLDFLTQWKTKPEDSEQRRIEMGHSKYYFLSLAISRRYAQDRTVWLAGGEGLYRSTDAGEHWEPLRAWQYGHIVYVTIVPDEGSGNTMLVSTKGNGCFLSTDGGASFAPFAESLRQYHIVSFDFSPNYPLDKTLYAASWESLFLSRDGGETWRLIRRPVRYEDDNRAETFAYKGSWRSESSPVFSAGRAHVGSPGDTAAFRFVGTGIRWITGRTERIAGLAEVKLDGRPVGVVTQDVGADSPELTAFTLSDLEYGPHRLTIDVIGEKGNIVLDAIDVYGSSVSRPASWE